MHAELWRRIAFTLGALFVSRLGAHIPLPGIDLDHPAIAHRDGLASIFALSITPYVTAAMLLQVLSLGWRRLRRLPDTGEAGRRVLERRTRLVAAAFAALQAAGIAGGLEAIDGLVTETDSLFLVTTVATLTAGMLFQVWLAHQITARGIGNGIALILFASIALGLSTDGANLVRFAQMGYATQGSLLALALLTAAVTVAAVAIERVRRRIPIVFPERRLGERTIPAQSVDLAVKLNPAGLLPAFVIGWFGLNVNLMTGGPWATLVVALVLIVLALIYVSFLWDPDRMADRLRALGGAVPGIEPGEATAREFDRIVFRTALVGAIYLVLILLLSRLPLHLPVVINGMWLLLVVCITIDVEAQTRAYLAQSFAPGAENALADSAPP